MATSSGYIAYVLEQLEALGPVTTKRMFGGYGLYHHGLFFALVSSQDEFYLKVDEHNRPMFEARGCKLFKPMEDRAGLNYMTVPEDVLEDPRELAQWARTAVEAQSRKSQARKKG